MKRVYYIIGDGGDGHSFVEWYREAPDLESLQEKYPDIYTMSEDIYNIFVPVDFDLDLLGVSFSD